MSRSGATRRYLRALSSQAVVSTGDAGRYLPVVAKNATTVITRHPRMLMQPRSLGNRAETPAGSFSPIAIMTRKTKQPILISSLFIWPRPGSSQEPTFLISACSLASCLRLASSKPNYFHGKSRCVGARCQPNIKSFQYSHSQCKPTAMDRYGISCFGLAAKKL